MKSFQLDEPDAIPVLNSKIIRKAFDDADCEFGQNNDAVMKEKRRDSIVLMQKPRAELKRSSLRKGAV